MYHWPWQRSSSDLAHQFLVSLPGRSIRRHRFRQSTLMSQQSALRVTTRTCVAQGACGLGTNATYRECADQQRSERSLVADSPRRGCSERDRSRTQPGAMASISQLLEKVSALRCMFKHGWIYNAPPAFRSWGPKTRTFGTWLHPTWRRSSLAAPSRSMPTQRSAFVTLL
jgi:hypothetical protein